MAPTHSTSASARVRRPGVLQRVDEDEQVQAVQQVDQQAEAARPGDRSAGETLRQGVPARRPQQLVEESGQRPTRQQGEQPQQRGPVAGQRRHREEAGDGARRTR
jgi:hypothetical protein